MELQILSSRTKETSLKNNKNWDDVLASFDIQNQDDNDLAFDDTNASTSSDTQTTEYSSNRWATRAFVLFGCAVALGNVPLQSFLPNAPSNQFEITLESGTTEKTDIKPTTPSSDQKMEFQLASVSSNKVTATVAPAIVAKEVTPTEVTDQNTDLVTDVAEDIVELQLPSRALETYTGHQLVNTASVWHTYTVQRYDNTYNAFSQVKQKDLHGKLKKIEPIAEALKDMKLGTIVRAKSHNGKIEQLAFTPDNERTFVIEPDGEGSYKGEWQKKVFEVRQARATFSVKNGLFLDGKKVNVPSNITRQVVSVFDWDIDFSHDVRVGDQVTVVYENIYHDGDLVGSQNLLAAEFINKGKIHRTVRRTTDRGLTDFFTPEGREMKRAFIRTPVEHARVSSHFNPGRFHPVLHKIRAHKGTDFAARTGTPIIATGDGEVKFLGRKGGYGKTIILKHREGYTTLYSHMSKYKSKLKQGQVVAQGDVIGYVGRTGLATGPHLHYEFRKNNIPADPLTVELPNSMSLTKKELKKFQVDAINMNLQLNVLHRFAMEKFDINSATGG
jgi:murein DD-endopeptidase MepM/ murein hydrolase activator NlpD